VTGRWVRVEGRERCQRCGQMVEAAWKWFATSSTWTRCYCDACTAELLEGDA
jgi:hypothetical protein